MAEESDEVEACQTFFKRTGGGDNWSDKWGWWDKSKDMKTYSGVRLDKDGHVAELMLPFNGLNTAPMANKDTGTDWGSGLNGLRFVQSVNLHGNRLEGSLSEAMDSACAMTRGDQFLKRPHHFDNLRNLDVCRNAFSGPFPKVLCALHSLEWINFSRNQLTGSIPENISLLKSLKMLDLSHNQFTGPLPSRGLRTLWKLQCLNVARNDVTGKLNNDLSRLTSLVVLNLAGNQFTGRVPSALSALSFLKKLELTENNLTGPIEDATLEHMTSLVLLNMSKNGFTGPVPEALSFLTDLRSLQLNGNQLTGMLPVDTLGNLTKSLRLLDLSQNALVVPAAEVELLKSKFPEHFKVVVDSESSLPDIFKTHLKEEKESAAEAKKRASEFFDEFVPDEDKERKDEGGGQLLAAAEEDEKKGDDHESGGGSEFKGEEGKVAGGYEGVGDGDAKETYNDEGGSNWEESWDDDSGIQMWYNNTTGETTYSDPHSTG